MAHVALSKQESDTIGAQLQGLDKHIDPQIQVNFTHQTLSTERSTGL
jgi:hypothetical protein